MKKLNELSKEEFEELERTTKQRLDDKAIILYQNRNGIRTCQLVRVENQEQCQKVIEKYVGNIGEIKNYEFCLEYYTPVWHTDSANKGTLPWGHKTLNGNVVITADDEEGNPLPLTYDQIKANVRYFATSSLITSLDYLEKVVYRGEVVQY